MMKINKSFFCLLFLSTYILAQEIMPANEKYGKAEVIPEEIKLRMDCFIGINLIIRYDDKVGTHNCNAAEFFLFAGNEKLMNVDGTNTANLNNGDNNEILADGSIGISKEILNPFYPNVGGARQQRFVINNKNAKNIFISGAEKVTLYLECTTPLECDRGHGFGKCHSDVPFVRILKTVLGKGEVVLYNNQPKIDAMNTSNKKGRVALITITPCGELIKEGI